MVHNLSSAQDRFLFVKPGMELRQEEALPIRGAWGQYDVHGARKEGDWV